MSTSTAGAPPQTALRPVARNSSSPHYLHATQRWTASFASLRPISTSHTHLRHPRPPNNPTSIPEYSPHRQDTQLASSDNARSSPCCSSSRCAYTGRCLRRQSVVERSAALPAIAVYPAPTVPPPAKHHSCPSNAIDSNPTQKRPNTQYSFSRMKRTWLLSSNEITHKHATFSRMKRANYIYVRFLLVNKDVLLYTFHVTLLLFASLGQPRPDRQANERQNRKNVFTCIYYPRSRLSSSVPQTLLFQQHEAHRIDIYVFSIRTKKRIPQTFHGWFRRRLGETLRVLGARSSRISAGL